MKSNLTILWLDDMREPNRYLNQKPDAKKMTLMRNLEFYKKIFDQYNVKFIWVKNIEEFSNYILKNGLPEFISFDHDLGSGLPKGLDCAKWLIEYCKKNNLQLPKYFVHSANPNGQREINGILGNIVLNEKQLRTIIQNIIKESLQDLNNDIAFIRNGNGNVFDDNGRAAMAAMGEYGDEMQDIAMNDKGEGMYSPYDEEGEYYEQKPADWGEMGFRNVMEEDRKIINWYDEVEKTYRIVAMIKSEMNPISHNFRATNIMDAIKQAYAYFSKFSSHGEKDVDIYYIKHDDYNGI